MRIGIDARFYSSTSTGIGRYVYELIDHLLKIDGQNQYVIFLSKNHFVDWHVPRKGVEKMLADSPHYSFGEQWHFWRLLEKAHLDLMHFTHFNAPMLYRRPSIVTIHDLTLSLHPGNKMNSFFERTAYHLIINSIVKRSKKVIAVSEHTKKDLVRTMHADPGKISVIHNGVNPQFHPIHDQKIIDDFLARAGLAKPYILYTGVWRSHKNLVNLIKAFAILKKWHSFTGTLVITGKEDPWYPEVKQAVKNEKLEGDVRFTGLIPDEDLVLLYNGALLYVLPSLYEGFGLPALEAFACGIPVCAANNSSLPEVCGEGNAVFFDPRDSKDMAEKILSVYTSEEKMKELSARGIVRAKEFSWSKMAAQTLELYLETFHVHPDSKNSPQGNQ